MIPPKAMIDNQPNHHTKSRPFRVSGAKFPYPTAVMQRDALQRDATQQPAKGDKSNRIESN